MRKNNWILALLACAVFGSTLAHAQSANVVRNPAKQESIQKLIQSAIKDPNAMPPVQSVIPSYALPKDAKDSDRYRLLSSVVLYGIHTWYVGKIPLPDETKADWSGLYCRAHWTEFEGHVSHPDVDSIKNDIDGCLGAAAAAAIAAGLFTGDISSASAAFRTALIGCLQSKGISWANDLNIWVSPEDRRGDWHYCL